MMTLQQVVETTGMSRRVIQEYEDYGLAERPTKKNKYGHLLYNDAQVERLWLLRFYHEIGQELGRKQKFDKKKIKEILCAPDFDREKVLEEQIRLLTEKRERLDELIDVAKAMKDAYISPKGIRHGITGLGGMESVSYDDMLNIIVAIANQSENTKESEVVAETPTPNDQWLEELVEPIEHLVLLNKAGQSFDSEDARTCAVKMYEIFATNVSDSIFGLWYILTILSSSIELEKDFDDNCGQGAYRFCMDSMFLFCRNEFVSGKDGDILKTIDSIVKLRKKKYPADSPEVQGKVKQFDEYLREETLMGEKREVSKVDRIKKLKATANLFESKGYTNIFDQQVEKGLGNYLSKAIRVYCDAQERTDKDGKEKI